MLEQNQKELLSEKVSNQKKLIEEAKNLKLAISKKIQDLKEKNKSIKDTILKNLGDSHENT